MLKQGVWRRLCLFARRGVVGLAWLALLPQCNGVDEPGEGGAGHGGDATGAQAANGAQAGRGGKQGGGAGEAASGGASTSAGAGGGSSGDGGSSGGDGGSSGGDGGSSGGDGGSSGETGERWRCEERGGVYCRDASDCPWYHGCVQQRCVLIPEGTPCDEISGSCGNADFCNDGQCKHRRVLGEEDCLAGETEGAICPEGSACYWAGPFASLAFRCFSLENNTAFCDGGVIPCQSDHYCPTYQGESGPPPLCVERGGLGDECVSEEPGSCLPGLSCEFYRCQEASAPAGTPCEPFVTGWNGSTFRDYDSTYPVRCAPGLACIIGDEGDYGECGARKLPGASCQESYECLDGFCNAVGACEGPSTGSTCGVGVSSEGVFGYSVCPIGEGCASRRCAAYLEVGDECVASKRPCPGGTTCSESAAGSYICTEIAPMASFHEPCSETPCFPSLVCVDTSAPN